MRVLSPGSGAKALGLIGWWCPPGVQGGGEEDHRQDQRLSFPTPSVAWPGIRKQLSECWSNVWALPCPGPAGGLSHPPHLGPQPPSEPCKWTLTAAAKVVTLVQPKEAVLASCAGQATHVGLAEALAVALGAEGEGGSRWGGVSVHLLPQPPAHQPSDSPAGTRQLRPACPWGRSCSLGEEQSKPEWGRGQEGLASVGPVLTSLAPGISPSPQYPLWADSRVQPLGLLGLSPQNPGLQRSQLGPST